MFDELKHKKVDDDEINEFLAALSMETGGEISHDDLIGLNFI